MKKAILIVTMLFACLGAESRTLKIMTFNIRFGERANMQQVAEVILREKPDLVALQEVDVFTHRDGVVAAGSTNYLSELSGYTKMHALFGRTIWFRGGEYGIGILSKYSFMESRNVPYSVQGAERRTALAVELELAQNEKIRFVCTHLEVADSAIRHAQMAELCDRYAGTTIPTIVAGDFNETSASKGVSEIFEQTFVRACGDQPTFPAENPRLKLDYVGYLPVGAFKVKRVKVVDTSAVSDHRAVIVKLKIRK